MFVGKDFRIQCAAAATVRRDGTRQKRRFLCSPSPRRKNNDYEARQRQAARIVFIGIHIRSMRVGGGGG